MRRDAGEAVDSVLVALADPTRRQLLELLAAQGEVSATTLAAQLPVSRQAVVKHLAVLDAAGLVSGGRVGREVRYEVRPAALDATARWMAALAVDWDRRLANIKRVAEAGTAGSGRRGPAAPPDRGRAPDRPRDPYALAVRPALVSAARVQVRLQLGGPAEHRPRAGGQPPAPVVQRGLQRLQPPAARTWAISGAICSSRWPPRLS